MKKVHTFWAVCALLGLLLEGSVSVEAQFSPHRVQSRAKVWDAFWNTGQQGIRESVEAGYVYRPLSFSYPGVFIADWQTEGPEYWGLRDFSGVAGYIAWNVEMTALSGGFDTMIATRAPGDPKGEYYVTESKPIRESVDVIPIGYDPSKGPEAKIGYRTVSPRGPVMTNWWPGQKPPGKDAPVEVHNYRYFKYMDPDKDTFPESIIISHYATRRGITVTKRVYAWGYPDYDDFQILEYEFENTGDSDGDGKPDLNGGAGLQLNDTFFIFATRLYISHGGHSWHGSYGSYLTPLDTRSKDDWYKYTEAPNYDGPVETGRTAPNPLGKGLKLWYAFDGDNPLIPGDDMGQPVIEDGIYGGRRVAGNIRFEGELTAYQYAGFAPIAYVPSDANDPAKFTFDAKGDARYVAPKVASQPYAVKWWDYRTNSDFDQPDSKTHTHQKMYELLAGPAPSVQAQPTEPTGGHASFAYGPYDLKLGDRVKIVVTQVAGAPVEENMWGWALTAKPADMRTDKAFKNLVKHLDKAREAFKWGYDLPDAPPDVDVKVGVTPDGNNILTWGKDADDAADPDYSGDEARDVKGYRVYRSGLKIDRWELMADIPVKDPKYYKGDRYEFPDLKSVAGFTYLYSVRTYDKGHSNWNGRGIAVPSLESGSSSPEQWAGGIHPYVPYVPATAAADQLQRKVVVVPNPYKEDGSHAYPSKGRIRFTNVPNKCTIRIYTLAGELFAEIKHNDLTRGETSWSQVPFDHIGTASPGIYHFVVESEVPSSLGKRQIGTFMIIK